MTAREALLTDHDLPMLRVHEALEAVRNLDPKTSREQIARTVINIIGEGTRRVGHVCPTCWKPIQWHNSGQYAHCLEHGTFRAPALCIAFPPWDKEPK